LVFIPEVLTGIPHCGMKRKNGWFFKDEEIRNDEGRIACGQQKKGNAENPGEGSVFEKGIRP
jgi:hypothetical protein